MKVICAGSVRSVPGGPKRIFLAICLKKHIEVRYAKINSDARREADFTLRHGPCAEPGRDGAGGGSIDGKGIGFLAFVFGFIQGGIRAAVHVQKRQARPGDEDRADAYGHSGLNGKSIDAFPDPPDNGYQTAVRLFPGKIGAKKHDELITAKPARDIVGAACITKDVGHILQNFVSEHMPVVVIDGFKIINVYDGEHIRGLRIDLVDTSLRVTNIKPGMVETNFSVVRYRGDKEAADNFYKGIRPLTGDDIAETVYFAASAPEHIQIAEVLLMPTNQATGTISYKKKQE